MARRIRWFGVAMIICFCGLLIQLDNIQGLKASQYQKRGQQSRHHRRRVRQAARDHREQ